MQLTLIIIIVVSSLTSGPHTAGSPNYEAVNDRSRLHRTEDVRGFKALVSLGRLLSTLKVLLKS
ncbi:hypothetical protein JNB11_08615 [Kocuria palustris]|nr:hypothetical protein [Kocuria palustris]